MRARTRFVDEPETSVKGARFGKTPLQLREAQTRAREETQERRETAAQTRQADRARHERGSPRRPRRDSAEPAAVGSGPRGGLAAEARGGESRGDGRSASVRPPAVCEPSGPVRSLGPFLFPACVSGALRQTPGRYPAPRREGRRRPGRIPRLSRDAPASTVCRGSGSAP